MSEERDYNASPVLAGAAIAAIRLAVLGAANEATAMCVIEGILDYTESVEGQRADEGMRLFLHVVREMNARFEVAE